MESMTAMTLCFMLTLLTFLIPDLRAQTNTASIATKWMIANMSNYSSSLIRLKVLSGYESDVYLNLLKGWEIHKTQARISAHVGTSIKTECLWINPACQAALEGEKQQPDMFVQEGQCG